MGLLFDNSVQLERQPFVVLLTGMGTIPVSGSITYSWIEQNVNPLTGSYQIADSPRQGSLTFGPWCSELNNRIVDTPTYARISLRCYVQGVAQYEFENCCGTLPPSPKWYCLNTASGSGG
jgi:hypothetical protein